MSKPVCQKCGRPLKDPASIAAGMGPECRGDNGKSNSYRHPRWRKQQARAARTQAFARGEPIAMGDMSYTRQDDGKWVNAEGRTIGGEYLKDYLVRYGWIDQSDGDLETFTATPPLFACNHTTTEGTAS